MTVQYDYIEAVQTANIADNAVTDTKIAEHTSTKITITTKGQLNSSIAYKDEANTFTAAQTTEATGGANSDHFLDTYGNGTPAVVGRRAKGSKAIPAAIQSGDVMLALGGRGYEQVTPGFSANAKAAILMKAAENWTNAAQGALVTIETTPIGSTARAVAVTINADKEVDFSGNIDAGTNKIKTDNVAMYRRSGNSRALVMRSETENNNTQLEIIVNGAGDGGIKSILNLWSTDFVTDTSNWHRLSMRTTNTTCDISSEKNGTGTLLPINIRMNSVNLITVGIDNSIKIGTTNAHLVGFHGVDPVDQAAHINDPAGGGTQDLEARTAINAILDLIEEKGLMAA